MATALRYAPDFRLTISTVPIPSALRAAVTGIKFQEGEQAADRVEVALANTDLRWLQQHIRGLGFQPFRSGVSIGGVRLPDVVPTGMFDIDNRVTLALGYQPETLEEVFVGEITGVQATFPSEGMPSLTVVAHDFLHRLAEGKYARGYGPLPDFLIAQILALENRLLPIVEPTIIGASTAVAAVNLIFNGAGRKQKSQSHLELLAEIAATYDADFHVEGDVLYLTRFMKEYTPRLVLTWGRSLIDFTPKMTSVGQAAGVAMKFTLREIPLDFLVKVYYDFDRESVGIVVLPGAAAPAAGGAVFTIIDRPIGSPADIMNSVFLITHELRAKLNKSLTGTGTAVGDPRIRAGAVIRLEGLGPDFSGDYRVTGVTHQLSSKGYLTDFEVQKELIP